MSCALNVMDFARHILFISRDLILFLDFSQALEVAGLPPGRHVTSVAEGEICPISCLAVIVDASDLDGPSIEYLQTKVSSGFPVFVIANDTDEAELFEVGQEACFLKPLVTDELVKVIRPLLSEYRYDRAG